MMIENHKPAQHGKDPWETAFGGIRGVSRGPSGMTFTPHIDGYAPTYHLEISDTDLLRKWLFPPSIPSLSEGRVAAVRKALALPQATREEAWAWIASTHVTGYRDAPIDPNAQVVGLYTIDGLKAAFYMRPFFEWDSLLLVAETPDYLSINEEFLKDRIASEVRDELIARFREKQEKQKC